MLSTHTLDYISEDVLFSHKTVFPEPTVTINQVLTLPLQPSLQTALLNCIKTLVTCQSFLIQKVHILMNPPMQTVT